MNPGEKPFASSPLLLFFSCCMDSSWGGGGCKFGRLIKEGLEHGTNGVYKTDPNCFYFRAGGSVGIRATKV
ncbi:hypothetical protein J3F84DRAFT_271142 [Trichoderma pleuroticola]